MSTGTPPRFALRGVQVAGGAVVLYALTGVANVLAFGYQFVMPRLLVPAEYAILTQLFGVLLVESIGTQVIQTATAKLAAQYRAREDSAALHVFVRRWMLRLAAVGAGAAAIVVALAGPIGGALALTAPLVLLLAATLFLTVLLTFALGLLQGLARFAWLGSTLVAQAATRLALGAALVLVFGGVLAAFVGATVAIAVALLIALAALAPLLRAARSAAVEAHLAPGETSFFLRAGLVILAYAGLTNVDAVLARVVLSEESAGAYAGAITMGKVVLFAPIAVGFILLERTARAHERGLATERYLWLSLGFVLATSGAAALAYAVAPALFVRLVVGEQYPGAVSLVTLYGAAALLNALLTIWYSYFIGIGDTRIGYLLALGAIVETAALLALARDPVTMVTIVLTVAAATQTGAVLAYLTRERRRA
ncbi:MAG TPA: hypothetical protein VFM93_13010 [Candidatus Limnocylindria bacterium]|nr:hypothetical protein [Candidatus Limnocylindria bacterium]